ncbi:hypothetical protein TNCV_1985861 [Trichonephila clavipes]|nr:hypothetical protein TNCV_1985861 [Trichonephila clavipes]
MSIIREKCSDIVLCKKVNGAMKTSSVDSSSQSPTPSPMKTKHSRFAMLEDSSSLAVETEEKKDRSF